MYAGCANMKWYIVIIFDENYTWTAAKKMKKNPAKRALRIQENF